MKISQKKVPLLGASLVALSALLGAEKAVAQSASNPAEFAAYIKALTAAAQPTKNVYMPGVMHAVVAPHGTGYASASIFTPRGGVPGAGADGSVSFGVGFGNAQTGVGGSLTLNSTGTVPFGSDGDFTLKFATALNTGKNPTYIGVQFNHLGPWGANTALPKSADISVTHFNSFDNTPYMVTIGYGTHNFTGASGVFGGIGFGLTKDLGFGVSVKNSRITAGFGYRVSQVPGMSLSLDFANINNAGPVVSNATVATFSVSFAKKLF